MNASQSKRFGIVTTPVVGHSDAGLTDRLDLGVPRILHPATSVMEI
jgi:hypothetical protein